MNPENIKPLAKVPEEVICAPDKQELFEKLKTPEELSAFMDGHINYGYVGKYNKRAYAHNSEDLGADMGREYKLQRPQELVESGLGLCWDSAELEREWFAKHGYDYKVYFLFFAKDQANNLPTHTFLAFEKGGQWCWFEHSFGQYRGIHEYDSLDALKEDVKRKQLDYAVKERGATAEDYQDLELIEYSQPAYGAGPNDFVDSIISGEIAVPG